jgi:PIN domain
VFRILIDTCVWIDLAKDYQQQAILSAIEELIRRQEVELILPRAVVEEFGRNKARIIEESRRSPSSTLKRVKEAVDKFGDPRQKNIVLSQLNDVDHRLPALGEAALETIDRIEKLFTRIPVSEISDSVKLRAAQRAIDKRAPFHRQRNGIDDAILIEAYADALETKKPAGMRFAFVTHNTKDFSQPDANDKLPHSDLTVLFSRQRSFYFTSLGEALCRVQPKEFADLMVEQEWIEEPRRLTEILDAMELLFNLVWYNRYQVAREKIKRGITKIVEKEKFPVKDHLRRPVQRDVWEGFEGGGKGRKAIRTRKPWALGRF